MDFFTRIRQLPKELIIQIITFVGLEGRIDTVLNELLFMFVAISELCLEKPRFLNDTIVLMKAVEGKEPYKIEEDLFFLSDIEYAQNLRRNILRFYKLYPIALILDEEVKNISMFPLMNFANMRRDSLYCRAKVKSLFAFSKLKKENEFGSMVLTRVNFAEEVLYPKTEEEEKNKKRKRNF